MKRLVLAVATMLTIGVSFAGGVNSAQDVKSLGAKLWKSPKATSSLRSQKAELATVYGGEDITHKLSSSTLIG